MNKLLIEIKSRLDSFNNNTTNNNCNENKAIE